MLLEIIEIMKKGDLWGSRAWKKITDNFALFTLLLTLHREVGGGGMGLAITQWPRASPDLKPPQMICGKSVT